MLATRSPRARRLAALRGAAPVLVACGLVAVPIAAHADTTPPLIAEEYSVDGTVAVSLSGGDGRGQAGLGSLLDQVLFNDGPLPGGARFTFVCTDDGWAFPVGGDRTQPLSGGIVDWYYLIDENSGRSGQIVLDEPACPAESASAGEPTPTPDETAPADESTVEAAPTDEATVGPAPAVDIAAEAVAAPAATPATPTPAGAVPAPTVSPSPRTALAATGADVNPWSAIVGATALLAGVATTLVARRRRAG